MTRKRTPTIRSRTFDQAAEEAFVELVVAAYPFIERSLRPAMRAKWDAAPEESRVAMVIRLLELDTFSDYEIGFIFAEHVRETLARDKFRHRPGERDALSSASTRKWRSEPTMAAVHLHHDDVPDTLALLGALLRDRSTLPAGYDPDETGANVDWDLLTSAESWLSTTEKAVVRIAHGCAILERHGGGLPVELRWQVRATVESTTK